MNTPIDLNLPLDAAGEQGQAVEDGGQVESSPKNRCMPPVL
jgi:hypothetical protein